MVTSDLDPVALALAIAILTTISIFIYVILGKGQQQQPSVNELNIYPIKSCAEIQVNKSTITPRRFRHDRVFQVVSKVDGIWSYCTPRDKAFEKLFHVKPIILDGGKSLELSSSHVTGTFTLKLDGAPTTPLVATTMGGKEVTLDDYGSDVADWLRRSTGIDCRLVGSI